MLFSAFLNVSMPHTVLYLGGTVLLTYRETFQSEDPGYIHLPVARAWLNERGFMGRSQEM